ncbi:MAG: hypothetical protein ACLFTH_01960 [Candidatus Woesearchaeota archaeon]
MCDFHYQKLCFHPDKVDAGQVAAKCEVHDCTNCTDRAWQQLQIKRDIDYFTTLLSIAKDVTPSEIIEPGYGMDDMIASQTHFSDPRVSPLPEASHSRLFRGV